jgi:hypothetical protein
MVAGLEGCDAKMAGDDQGHGRNSPERDPAPQPGWIAPQQAIRVTLMGRTSIPAAMWPGLWEWSPESRTKTR